MNYFGLPITIAKRHARACHGYVSAIGHSAPNVSTGFLILAGGRRGSHLLIDLLTSHSDVHVDGEILHANAVPRLMFPGLYLKGLRARRKASTYGFKVSLWHFSYHRIDPLSFLSEFADRGGHIIYLHRRNFFRSAVSRQIAHQRGIHRDTVSNPLQGLRFAIDCTKVIEEVQKRTSQRQEECNTLSGIPHLSVNCENDLLDPENQQAACDRIFRFLGCDSTRVTSFTKRSPPVLTEVVSNYDELAAAVSQAGWSHLLADKDYEARTGQAA